MEAINGATVFWLITLGMIAGGATKVVMWNSTVDLLPNVIIGTVAALVVGCSVLTLRLPGSLLFAFIGTLAVLFVVNVFNQPQKSPEATH